jgi:ATP-binding protein involved in chromosome partitioning
MQIRETSDSGQPVVVSNPGGAEAKTYQDIATKVWERVGEERAKAEGSAPAIVFE